MKLFGYNKHIQCKFEKVNWWLKVWIWWFEFNLHKNINYSFNSWIHQLAGCHLRQFASFYIKFPFYTKPNTFIHCWMSRKIIEDIIELRKLLHTFEKSNRHALSTHYIPYHTCLSDHKGELSRFHVIGFIFWELLL